MRRGGRAGARLARLRRKPVVLDCPLPVAECLRRLEAVTSSRSYSSWHLNPANVGRPAPRFRGSVGGDRVLVAQFRDAGDRNSFAAWLEARLEPAAAGGTTLIGSVGLRAEVRAVMLIIFGGWSLMALTALAAGIALAASGHPLALLPGVLVPLGGSGILAGFTYLGLRSLGREVPGILGAVASVLESTTASPLRDG